MNDSKRDFINNNKISTKDKWEFLNNLENKDSDKVADLYRYFMQKNFRYIPLEERPNNKYWKLAFDELINAKYDINYINSTFEQTYKPYALFKLIRDNAMPQEYKKIIYNKHREYYLNNISIGSLEFTRIMMHFTPYLINEDKFRIGVEIAECKYPRKYIIDFVRDNNVLDKETLNKVNSYLVAKKLCGNK